MTWATRDGLAVPDNENLHAHCQEATMRAKVLNESPERTIALVLDKGDEVMSTLQRFAADHNLIASRLTAIGAFESATLGYFDWKRKEYERIPVHDQVEVLSLVGDIALDGNKQGARARGARSAQRQHGGRAFARSTRAAHARGAGGRLTELPAAPMRPRQRHRADSPRRRPHDTPRQLPGVLRPNQTPWPAADARLPRRAPARLARVVSNP